MWRRLLSSALAVSLMATGLVVLAQPVAHAAADAVVSGTIVDSVTHQPLASVTVTDANSGRTATTAAAGTYSLSVPAGDHVLTATLAGYVPYSTPTLTLTAAQALTQGFTLEKYASASGTVTEKGTTTGIASIVVKFFDAATQSPNPLFAATTGPDGSWSIPKLAPGSYTVQFVGAGHGFGDAWLGGEGPGTAAVVVVSPGEGRNLPIEVQRVGNPGTRVTAAAAQGSATISGHITVDPGGMAASAATVVALDVRGYTVAQVGTDPSGAYALTGLSAGYYVVAAESVVSAETLVGYFGGGVSRPLATYVWVAEASTLAGQDIHLKRTATVEGLITHGGAAVSGAIATMTGMGTVVSSTPTSSDGAFSIVGVPPGTYRLAASSTDQVVWWSGAPDIGAATEITVATAATMTGYAMALPTFHRLSGTLRSPAGVAAANTRVAVTNGSKTSTVFTDALGRYTFSLAPGSYELGLFNLYGNVSWSPGYITPHLVDMSADAVMDVTQPIDQTVTFHAVTSDGSQFPSSTGISVKNSHQEYLARVEITNGSGTLQLPAGIYGLSATRNGFRPWSSQVTVTAATEVSVTWDVGGRIEGNVSASATVATVINVATGERATQSILNGRYSIGGLASGDYVVTSAPSDSTTSHCGPAVWLGGTSYLTATRLHVESGTRLTGQNLEVPCQAGWTPRASVSGALAFPSTSPAGAAAGTVVYATSALGVFTAVPDAQGGFDFEGLTPGMYEIAAYQSVLGMQARTTMALETGVPTLITLNMTRRALIAGQVVGPGGEPLAATVSNGETSAVTDAQGRFSLGGVSFGSHTISVQPDDGLYAPAFVAASVSSGSDLTGLTIHVHLGGRLSGRLSAAAGNVQVAVTDAADRVVAVGYFSGQYSFDSLPPGPVKLRFSGAGIVTEWWRDATDRDLATAIQVPEGGGVADVTPNLSPPQAGESLTTISGSVTFASSPLPGVTITTRADGRVITATTRGDGTYSLTVPRGDTYTLKAETCFGPSAATCTGQAYADTRSVFADRAIIPGMDFVVPSPAASFSVLSQPIVTGRPAVDQTLTATVAAWTPTPDSTTWQWYADGLPIYNATGNTYSLTSAEMGKRIQVVVTRSKAGYATLTLPSVASAPVEVPGAVISLTPSRLLDSRSGLGFSGPAGNGTVITLPVWGKGGVPQGASAVLMNLTVTQPTAGGFLTAYASGGSTPTVSNANFVAGTTIANLSLVPVGADGAIAIKASVAGSVHVIADVQGYIVGGAVSAAGAVVPVTPTRLLDTRSLAHVAGGGTVTLPVAGVAGVPADATAVVVNITVTGPTGPGFLTAWPAGQARPTASNVNFVKNQTVPNMAIVKVGDAQSISIFNANSGQVDVVVDIQGYVTAGVASLPGTVKPITPTRVVDTRIDQGAYGPVPANNGAIVDFDSLDLKNIPQGVLINLTVTEPQASGWLSAYPYGVPTPSVSNLNFTAGAVVPNLSLVTLNSGYGVLYNGSPGYVDMVADVLAYVLS